MSGFRYFCIRLYTYALYTLYKISDRPKLVFDRNRYLHIALPNQKPYRNKFYNFTKTDTETETETD